jgi:DNA repair exonuclease SbcCD nuclease subunit
MHLTDVHLAYDKTGKPLHKEADYYFHKLLGYVREMDLDLLALTGDIISYPSKINVEKVRSFIENVNVFTIFTSGNHDWSPELNPEENLKDDKSLPLTVRNSVRESGWLALDPITNGQPEFQVKVINGVRIIAIDNSTYQITSRQLKFLKEHLDSSQPIVLLFHIPISLPTLRPMTIETWSQPILIADPAWNPKKRYNICGTRFDTLETLEFVHLITTCPNLVAILCGHIHFQHIGSVNRIAIQYVCKPSWHGEYRLVELLPL